MPSKLTLALIMSALLLIGCGMTEKGTPEKSITRDQAETLALEHLYSYTTNKEIYDKELKAENYVFDSWKDGSLWHVIIYVGNTFIEVWVYDDGTGRMKILPSTDYWSKVPEEVKEEINRRMNL